MLGCPGNRILFSFFLTAQVNEETQPCFPSTSGERSNVLHGLSCAEREFRDASHFGTCSLDGPICFQFEFSIYFSRKIVQYSCCDLIQFGCHYEFFRCFAFWSL